MSPALSTRSALRALVIVLASALPAAALAFDLWTERSLRILQTTAPAFPAALAAQGVSEGEVAAVLQVDAEGKLLDCLVTGYTHRELADELVSGLREWSFEPAVQRGERIGARAAVNFAFQAHGLVTSATSVDALIVASNRIFAPSMQSLLCRPADLDEPLRAVHVVPPRHPGKSVAQPPERPTAVLDFYIDANGVPRMPAVLRSSHDHYAAAAMDALLQWRFTPPTRHGKPAVVRVTQTFVFERRS